jgi:hypothetical protein
MERVNDGGEREAGERGGCRGRTSLYARWSFLLMNQAGQGVSVPVRVAILDKMSMETT